MGGIQYEPIQPFPIELNGDPFEISISSWQGRDVIDFSPRASVPGSGQVYSDLSVYQPIAQDNWQRGFGFIWHDDEAGYLNTTGLIDTRHKNAFMLFTEPVSSDTNLFDKKGGVAYQTGWFTWGQDGVRKFEADVWAGVNIQSPSYDTDTDWEAAGLAIATAGTLDIDLIDIPKSGQNTYAIAAIAIDDATNVTDVTVTFEDNAMTEITGSPSGTSPQMRIFSLSREAGISPPSDPDDPEAGIVDVTCQATFTISSGTVDAVMGFIFLQNVDPGTQFGTVDIDTGSAGTTTNAEPTAAPQDFALSFIATDGLVSDTLTIDQGEVIIMQKDDGTDLLLAIAGERQIDGQTTVDLTYTWTNNRDFEHVGVAVLPQPEQPVSYMLENGEFLFASVLGGRLMRSADGTNWEPAGLNENSINYDWLAIHNGFVWAGQGGDSEIYFDSEDDLGQLHGNATEDTDSIPVGPGKVSTLGATSFLEKLMVTRPDGLWAVDPDETTQSKTQLDFADEKDVDNFRSMKVHQGDLFFPLLNRIFTWNGTRLQEITPDFFSDVWPFQKYTRFDNLASYDRWLFTTARTNVGTYTESIFAYDGAGFHKLIDAIEDGDGQITMVTFDPLNKFLWYHVSKPQAGTEETFYIEFDPDSDLPFSNFPTTGTHQLETSRIHAGFRRISKSVPQLIMYTDNCSETVLVEVYYRVDGDREWKFWNQVQKSGVTVLDLPGGEISVEFDFIELAFRLKTNDSEQTPVVKGFVLRGLLRPEVLYGYAFDIIAENEHETGMHLDLRLAVEVKDDIRRARASNQPIKLVSPFKEEIFGYVTSVTESAVEWEPEGDMGGIPGILMNIHVTFVEALVPLGTESFSDTEPETAVVIN